MEEHVKLRDYIERIFDERDKQVSLTTKALDLRLEGLNKLRDDVIKDRTMFLTKDVYEQMHSDLVRRVLKNENFMARMTGIGLVLIVVSGVLGAVIGALTTHMMK